MQKIDVKKTIILLMVCLLIFVAVGFILVNARQDINRGLDISGGIYILLEAVDVTEEDLKGDAIERAIAIIQHRIDDLGVVEPVVQKQGEDRIRVELPGYEDERLARELIGRTAQLSFVGPDEVEILTGEHLTNAGVSYDQNMRPVVSIEFDSVGAEAFKDATAKFLNQIIYIYLDEEMLSAPTVQTVISDGSAIITGSATMEEASYLATMLRSGALPVSLEEQEFRMVGPTLGERTEEIGIIAAGIGLLAVLLFLIFYYRVLGVMAGVALIFYLGIVLGILTALNATLTLPGIAGIILSIGMAVDANIIIFERIREEFKLGRTILGSLEAGFERAFSTILDANVTTMIAAIVLFAMATGPVRGFAVTLFVGIICSMIASLVITRILLRLAFRSKILKSGSNMGVKMS